MRSWLLGFAAAAVLLAGVNSSHADPAGSPTGGTRGTQSWLAGGTYNSSPPSLSTGQQIGLQTDSSGNLKVSVEGGSASNPCADVAGDPVPGSACYSGVNVGGSLVGVTGVTIGGATGNDVNLMSVAGTATETGHGTASGALRVELPTDGTGKVGLNAGSAIVGKVGIDQTTPGTTNGVQVNAALPAGSNIIGRVGIDQTTPGTTNLVSAAQSGTWTVQPGNTANTTPWLVTGSGTAGSAAAGVLSVQGIASMTPVQVSQATASNLNATVSQATAANLNATVSAASSTTGGVSTYAALGGTGNALLTNSAVAVKSGAGSLYGVNFYNPNSSVAYVQLFNVASGSVTLGTTVPKLSYAIPPNGWMDTVFPSEAKIDFSTALTVAATTTATGNGAPSTGITANILYK